MKRNGQVPQKIYPGTSFAVLSDLHYFHPTLGTDNPAFAKMFWSYQEIKMIRESADILAAAVQEIIALPVDFVLICGDLTKDGELASHWHLAMILNKISTSGKKVFVINGNHDINNIRACRYNGTTALRTATASPEQFVNIYKDHGYAAALKRDEHSLSYVAEPVPGLWLVVLDSCLKKFGEEGMLSPGTMKWVTETLDEARNRGKAVIGMMHHGVLEHYPGNKKYFAAYVLNNHLAAAELFSRHGLNIVFTGHFHAQDIALKQWPAREGKRFLFDIETGSLVTYPCPYRVVTVNHEQQVMHIESRYITATPGMPVHFPEYAYGYAYSLTEKFLCSTLKEKWRLSDRDIRILAPQLLSAFEAHCTGNEQPGEPVDFNCLSLWGRIVLGRLRGLIEGLNCTDPPPDNHITIDLATGDYK